MFEEMQIAGLTEPHYVQTSGSVRVTLSSTPLDTALDELMEASGNSRPTVIRDLKALENERLILWVGKSKRDPRAYWTLAPASK